MYYIFLYKNIYIYICVHINVCIYVHIYIYIAFKFLMLTTKLQFNIVDMTLNVK